MYMCAWAPYETVAMKQFKIQLKSKLVCWAKHVKQTIRRKKKHLNRTYEKRKLARDEMEWNDLKLLQQQQKQKFGFDKHNRQYWNVVEWDSQTAFLIFGNQCEIELKNCS